jgi:hypothetical protein
MSGRDIVVILSWLMVFAKNSNSFDTNEALSLGVGHHAGT